jgi:hypothetical protein
VFAYQLDASTQIVGTQHQNMNDRLMIWLLPAEDIAAADIGAVARMLQVTRMLQVKSSDHKIDKHNTVRAGSHIHAETVKRRCQAVYSRC